MAGKEDAGLAVIAQAIDVLDTHDLDPAITAIDLDFRKVRKLGGDAAQVVPHGADDALDLGIGHPRIGGAQVAPGPVGEAEARADRAADEAAHGRGPVERQQAAQHVGRERPRRLDRMQKVFVYGPGNMRHRNGET